MRFLTICLVLVASLTATGIVLADHDGPGTEAGSGKSEHPGKEVPASPSPSTTPPASPSPSPAR